MRDDTGGEAPPAPRRHPHTKSHNIAVGKRRSGARLEPEIREALREISEREGVTQAELCAVLDSRRRANQTLSSALRTFVVAYFRNAAHEEWARKKS